MYLTSPDFETGHHFSQDFTCDGSGDHPELHIHELPSGTASLALIVQDEDAPNGSYAHWLLWNIEPHEGLVIPREGHPSGSLQGVNSAGEYGWRPPCPPADDPEHHYHFKVYALDHKLDIGSNVSHSELREALDPYILEKAEIIGKYGR